jgi:predicted methyltransferase
VINRTILPAILEEGVSSMRMLTLIFATSILVAACSQPEAPVSDDAEMPTSPATDVEMAPAADETAALPDAIERAVADASRPETDRQLDLDRHPAEVLTFAGVEPGWMVADLTAGSGYYSRVLSTAVGELGHVWAQNPDWVADRFPEPNAALGELAAERANMSHAVAPIADFANGLDQPLDAFFMVLFYHDTGWDGTDRAAMNTAIFDALKPGGVYLVIDHRAPEGTGLEHVNTTHRIDEMLVRDEILAAGFELAAESEMLANADDPRDISVFDESIRRRTDRFALLFRKPG